MGGDCGDRICPFGRAFMDAPKGDLDGSEHISAMSETIVVGSDMYHAGAQEEFPLMQDSMGNQLTQTGHDYAECSNVGLCDRTTGQCHCFPGFSGSSCSRTQCSRDDRGDCSGHGKCEHVGKVAADDYSTVYELWDKETLYGCVCDPGYSGIHCNERRCPIGVDPRYYLESQRTVPVTVVTFSVYDTFCHETLRLEAYPFLRRLSDVERSNDASASYDEFSYKDEYVRRGILSLADAGEEHSRTAFAERRRRRLLAIPDGTTVTYEGTYGSSGIPDGTGTGVKVATLAADPNDDATGFTLGGADAASFSVENTNELTTAATLTYAATGGSVTIELTATNVDGDQATATSITITVIQPAPTILPIPAPTILPIPAPTILPIPAPTILPIPAPTRLPTGSPSSLPTLEPTALPTPQPTGLPTPEPTTLPTLDPTGMPTLDPTGLPSLDPTGLPTPEPTGLPTLEPTLEPTALPTLEPTGLPTLEPTTLPTLDPTGMPTLEPTGLPSPEPTGLPTLEPTSSPTLDPTGMPTLDPTGMPTLDPTGLPSLAPTGLPTLEPTSSPTLDPTGMPTLDPTGMPTLDPTGLPSLEPTGLPTPEPTGLPTLEPTLEPTALPTPEPTSVPTAEPTTLPTLVPTPLPTLLPTPLPSSEPSLAPSRLPTLEPTPSPSPLPTIAFFHTDSTLTGTFALKFYDAFGEDYVTKPINLEDYTNSHLNNVDIDEVDSCTDIVNALEALPNTVIEPGSVVCEEQAYGIGYAAECGISYSLTFTGNPGYLKDVELDYYLDGNSRATIMNHFGEPGVNVSSQVYTQHNVRSTDHWERECEGVTVYSKFLEDSYLGVNKWGYLDLDSSIEWARLARCLGDSDGIYLNNVEVYDWDYGSVVVDKSALSSGGIRSTAGANVDRERMSGNPHIVRLVPKNRKDIYERSRMAVRATNSCRSLRSFLLLLSRFIGFPFQQVIWVSQLFRGNEFGASHKQPQIWMGNPPEDETSEFIPYVTDGVAEVVFYDADGDQVLDVMSDYEPRVTARFSRGSNLIYTSYDTACETASRFIQPCLDKGDLLFLFDLNWGRSARSNATDGNGADYFGTGGYHKWKNDPGKTKNPYHYNNYALNTGQMYTVKKVYQEKPTAYSHDLEDRYRVILDKNLNWGDENTTAAYDPDGDGISNEGFVQMIKFSPATTGNYEFARECSGRGKCDLGDGSCVCDGGFFGVACDVYDAVSF